MSAFLVVDSLTIILVYSFHRGIIILCSLLVA